MTSLDELTYLFGHTESLPELPDSPLKLAQLIESSDPNAAQIEALILADPALTVGIIKAASSALYARSKPVTTIREAVTILGHRSLRALAIACWTNSLARIHSNKSHLTAKRFAQNGNTVSNLAASLSLSQSEHGTWNQEELLAAGALHNVLFGLLSFVDHQTYNEIYNQAKSATVTLDQVFLMNYGDPIGTLAPRAATALGLPEFFIQTVNCINTPFEDQDASQACLTTAKAVAETQTLGLGDWQVPFPQTPIALNENEIEPLVQLATARPGLLNAA
ncbi:MAG: HDOD domain-containing protein [Fimbriimonadaceae bacterium]